MRRPAHAGPPHWEHYRGRDRFVRRAGLVFGTVLVLSAIGAGTLISTVLRSTGLSTAGRIGEPLLNGLLGLAVLALLFWFTMRRFALPLGNVIEASERVSTGDFSVRVKEYGPPALRSFARAFNEMTARLHDHEQRRQQYMSDIAHELRTPLAIIQGRLEGIIDGVYAPTDDQIKALAAEAKTLARLVEDLRTLANAETGALSLRREPTDLAQLLYETAAGFDGQSGVTIRVQAEPLPSLEIDPVRIREVAANLISNAVQSSPPGSVVDIRASVTKDHVTLVVDDRGRGIAPDRLPHIFDRFYKDPDSRGSGLGLSIVRSLVQAHRGTIDAQSIVGAGTKMTVTLPIE